MTVSISTDLTNAHYVDSARNNNDSVSTSTVEFQSEIVKESNSTPGKTQITTAQELQDINNNLSDDYEILNDIDLDGLANDARRVLG